MRGTYNQHTMTLSQFFNRCDQLSLPIVQRIFPRELSIDRLQQYTAHIDFAKVQGKQVINETKQYFPIFKGDLSTRIKLPGRPTRKEVINSLVINWPLDYTVPPIDQLRLVIDQLIKQLRIKTI